MEYLVPSMRLNKIPNCCVAAIHQRLINILDFQYSLPNITYLSCNNCGKGYRLGVRSGEGLTSKIDCPGDDFVYYDFVDIKGNKQMESRFECFAVAAEPKHDSSFIFIDDYEESEQVDKL